MNDLSTYIPEMIETRRYLHRIPEIAWTEFLTSELVIKRVRELGFKTIIGKALFNEEYAYGREDSWNLLGIRTTFLKHSDGYFLNIRTLKHFSHS